MIWSPSRKTAVEMRTGMRSPVEPVMVAAAWKTGLPVVRVLRRAQACSQMSARNSSQQKRPSARCRGTPVVFSAARLKLVIRHSRSTVKTASLRESRMGLAGKSTLLPGYRLGVQSAMSGATGTRNLQQMRSNLAPA